MVFPSFPWEACSNAYSYFSEYFFPNIQSKPGTGSAGPMRLESPGLMLFGIDQI